MKKYKQFQESLRDETFHIKIRITFHICLLTLLICIAIFGYPHLWKMSFPKFLYTDVFEYGIVTLFIYILYFLHLKKIHFVIRIILTLTMLSSLILLAYYKSIDRGFHHSKIFDDMMSYVGFGLLLFLTFMFIDNLHIFLNRKYHDIRKTLKEAETQLLKQQFNPHFLFNALNSVYSMALNNHPKTADTILTLSSMMRYLSDDASTKKVPLKYEIDFLHSYISMEKTRFGNDADIVFNVNDMFDFYMVEPLILITLIENAFKHGFYTNDKNSFVHIDLQVQKNLLILNVTNRFFSHAKNGRNGKGLEIFQKRLELSYEKKYALKHQKTDNIYRATLSLDLTE